MDNTTQVQFGGDATGAVDAARKAAEAVKNSVQGMQASLGSMKDMFGGVTKGFAAISMAVAGGAALKNFVQEADAVTKAATGMGRALGISATDASVFRQALDDVGVEGETVEFAGKRIAMSLRESDAKFKALGVSVRDGNGNLRNSRDIMLDVNEKLRGFKEGTDRNIESMKIYGRSYDSLSPFINKFTGALEDQELAQLGLTREQNEAKSASEKYAVAQQLVREKAEALNLVVGKESVEASKKYGLAKRDLNDVFEGVNRTIGEALIPRLTKMAEFFSSHGPAAVSIMRGVMAAYLTIQDAISSAVMTFFNAARQVFTTIGSIIARNFAKGSEPMTGMEFFGNVIKTIQIAVLLLRFGFETAFTIIGAAISGVLEYIDGFGAAMRAIMTGDWDQIGPSLKRAWDNAAKASEEGAKNVVKIATKGREDLEAIALSGSPTQGAKVTETKAPGAGGTGKNSTRAPEAAYFGDGGSGALEKGALAASAAVRKEAIAEALRDIEDRHQKELLSDREFYTQKAALEAANIQTERMQKENDLRQIATQLLREQAEGHHKLATMEAAGAGEADKAKARSEIAEKHNKLLGQRAALQGELQALTMREADVGAQAARNVEKAERDRSKKMAEIRIESGKKLAEVDLQMEEEALNAKIAMGLVSTEEEYRQQAALAAKRYALDLKSLQDRLELAEFDAAERMRLEAQVAEAQARYQRDAADRQAKLLKKQNEPMLNMIAGWQSALENSLMNIFDRTKTFAEKMKALWVDMAKVFVREMVQKVVREHILGEKAKALATQEGAITRVAMEWWAAAQSVAATVWAAIKEIAIWAYKAAAAVYQAIAGIPYVGPFLAPVMAGAALAAVISYGGKIASAEGGFDIPAGVNPMTQLHEREMVLPAKHADTIRALGEGGGAGGGAVHHHYSVQAADARSFRRLLMDNAPAVGDAVRKQARNSGINVER